MKSFSPCGMAVKAFYGLLPGLYAAKTISNPDGNLSGDGEWSKGKGPVTPPVSNLTGFTAGGPNSTGPWFTAPLFPPSGSNDFGAFATGQNNGGHAYGAIAPAGAHIAGATITALGWQDTPDYFLVAVNDDTLAQNAFTKIVIGAPGSLSLLTAAATFFDNTTQPGFSLWAWAVSAPVGTLGQTMTAVVS